MPFKPPKSEEMESLGHSVWWLWDTLQTRCPSLVRGGAAVCLHPDNPTWTASCEIDACPYIRKGDEGEST